MMEDGLAENPALVHCRIINCTYKKILFTFVLWQRELRFFR